MRVNSIHASYRKSNNVSFNARLAIHNSVVPYLRAQSNYFSLEKDQKYAVKWATETWNNIMYLGNRLKKVLLPDTPFVVAANNEAIGSILKNKKSYSGLDGLFAMDGKSMFVPAEYMPAIEYYTTPINFKFGPDKKVAEGLIDKISQIPTEIAALFKPHF